MRVALLVFALIALHAASAATLDVRVDIGADGSVHEEFLYAFSAPYNQSFTHVTDGEIQNVSVTGDGLDLPFTLENATGGVILNMTPNASVELVNVSFVRKDRIFSNEQTLRFFTTIAVDKNLIRNMSVWVALPLGFGVHERAYVPASGVVTSDGQRVVVAWVGALPEDVQVFSVTYAQIFERERPYAWMSVSGGLLLLLLILLPASLIYFRRGVLRTPRRK